MDQYQPNEVQQLSSEQRIRNIDDNFENIRKSIINRFTQIPPKSLVLLFLGKFENKFNSFYNHFEIKQVILENYYYKLVKIEKQGKVSYLLHFPLILLYDNENDEIAQNLCISKIYAEKALYNMENCYFYLILDLQQLTGDDDKGKLDNVYQDSIFYFGTQYFAEDHFFSLRYKQEDKWDCYQLSKENGLLSLFSKSEKLQVSTHSQHEVLKVIFNTNNYVRKERLKDQINYGKMMTYLNKQSDLLKKLLNDDLKHFQLLLIRLQQMPIIKGNSDVAEEIENYLNELQAGFNIQANSLNDNILQIANVYNFINKVNQGQNAQRIKTRIQGSQNPQMKKFLEQVEMKQLSITSLPSNKLIKNVINFLSSYHFPIFKSEKICEVQKLILNLKQWSAKSNATLENTLYELKHITSIIQDGPIDEIQNGIYFIGITKAGKSTIINSLLNSENIIKGDILIENCYQVEKETQFAIGQSGVSETQNINGVYIGKKAELNQIFNQNEKHVFSIEEILDKEQIQKCKIPQKYFLFDCPGFDDNSNELMRIAHRISLYNYFKKTKNIIVFFVIDISIQSIQNIKNTFDPITYLLEDKRDLETHFEKWTNIILTKAQEGQRIKFLQNWKLMYKDYLEENYSFYKKLFQNSNRCIEFKQQQYVNNIYQNIDNLADSIIKMSQQQFAENQAFRPKFQGAFDTQVQQLYEYCIPKIKQKFEHILKFLILDLDEYILDGKDNIEQKKVEIEKLQSILLNKNTQQIINVITYQNCKQILQQLSDWIIGNPFLQKNDIFLQQYIEDMKSIFIIQQYCRDNNQVAPFQLNIDKLINKIKTIILKIEETNSYYQNWKYAGYAGGFITGFMTCGSALALAEVQVMAYLARRFLLTRGTLWCTTLGAGSVTFGTGFIVNLIDDWKNVHLRKKYQGQLDNENNQ